MIAQEILKLIETVDPSDTAKMDEIDARVDCYLAGHIRFVELLENNSPGAYRAEYINENYDKEFWPCFSSEGQYTRSRDALKAIRPDGWGLVLNIAIIMGRSCEIFDYKNGKKLTLKSPTLPTEELAELHAIIQAIEFERNAE